jgi:hypothetical protein
MTSSSSWRSSCSRSFEVFVELSFWDGLKGNQVAVLAPITSKLRSKKMPDLCIKTRAAGF